VTITRTSVTFIVAIGLAFAAQAADEVGSLLVESEPLGASVYSEDRESLAYDRVNWIADCACFVREPFPTHPNPR